MSKASYQITKNKLMINTKYKNKMKTYCIKCKKDPENVDPKTFKTKNNKLIMQSQCTDHRNKKSGFVKKQDAKGLLSNLGIKTPLNKIPLLGDILF